MRTALFLLLFGYILSTTQGTPLVLFANRRDVCLVDAGQAQQRNSTVVVTGLDDAAALDFLHSDGAVFWTDVGLEMIKMAYINNSAHSIDVITRGLVSPDGLACDWLARKLYWTDSETNRIEVSNVDGSYRKVLYWENLDQPRAITLDPLNGYMYWTDWGEHPKIERAGMDGHHGSRQVIIKTDIFWPNGLTVDYADSKIFWADAKLHFIHSCNFDGTGRRVVVDGSLPHPFALTLYEDNLYWTDWQSQAIYSCNKYTGLDRTEVLSNIYSPMDIHVYQKARQPLDVVRNQGVNPCGAQNGGCSHLCLMSPYQPYYTCACPSGVQLLPDNKTCANGAKELLLLVRRTDIRRISLDTPDYTDVVLQLDNIRHAIAIDYDSVDGHLYWTDDEVQAISRSYLDGSGQEQIISTEVDHPDGVAVDWIARNLYWTDTGTDRIEVSRLNGTSRKVLIAERLDEPRAICLDPVDGYMYWTDWGKLPKIERALLDGSERLVLFNTSLGWPNGLALDFIERKIYWGDAKTDRIEVANMDGTGRRILVQEESRIPHIFGFSLLGEYIYWTDWQKRSIERIEKHTGRNHTFIIDQLPDLMGLKAVDMMAKHGTNPCGNDNGGCSHLCLYRPLPKGPVCACPMGMELIADNRTCIVPEAFLLFSHRTDIRRISLETNHNDAVIPLTGVRDASALDFDINDHRIYWTDIYLKSINRAFMNGSAMESVVKFGLDFPEGMAVDWVAHNLYWADIGTGRIEMSRMDGSSRRVLLWKDIDPRAIALDPPRGFMYWSNWGNPDMNQQSIERSALDGTHRMTLFSGVGRVNGLTIDFSEDRLFWTNLDNQVIESASLQGHDRQQIIHGLPHPFGLTQYEDFIFWTDWQDKSIERANKSNGLNRTRIHGQLDYIMDISVFHSSRQSGWNPCQRHNGACSHLCIAHFDSYLSPATHHCECPTHFTLMSDNSTCRAPESFLLYSQKNATSRMSIEAEESPTVVLPIDTVRNIKALAYDPVEGFIFWIEGRKGIRKAKPDGSGGSQLVQSSAHSGELQPFDIAVEPFSRHLFWSDQVQNVINVTRLDGKPIGVVIMPTDVSYRPRHIALSPSRGLLFWTNRAQPSSIMRSRLDGRDTHELVPGLTLAAPGPLAVDEAEEKLYWADTDLKQIKSVDFDGANMRMLADYMIKDPVGLTVFGDHVYWIDRGHDLIERMDKTTGMRRTKIQSRVNLLTDIIAAEALTLFERRDHPCGGSDNGGCSDICMAEDGRALCSCPQGLQLSSDGRSCTDPPTCTHDEFSCLSGGTCIPLVWHCDGQAECPDGSDEIACPDCSGFRCRSGQCISLKERCDSEQHCTDGSDEEQCPPCRKEEFLCRTDKKCIPENLKCNKVKNCASGDDEDSCSSLSSLEPVPHAASTTNYTISIIVGFIVLAFIVVIVLVFVCKRKSVLPPDDDDCHAIALTKTVSVPQPPKQPRGKGVGGPLLPSLASSLSDSGPPYDRNHVTGASSSSSAMTQYPPDTLNPPPSPITDPSQCGGGGGGSTSPSTVWSFRPRNHHRHKRRTPAAPALHNTPYSTDLESEGPIYTRPIHTKRKQKYHALLYDSEDTMHPPPPPTPRSQYCLDGCGSECPPSPSTERSFFNPLPPPPSPVNHSDC